MTVAGRIRSDSPSDLVLLLLYANDPTGNRSWSGVTRLQKLAFLASKDPTYEKLARQGDAPMLQFEAYKMGPFTSELYEALQTLTGFEPPLVFADAGSPADQDDVETARYVDEVDLDYPGVTSSAPRPTSFRLSSEGKIVARRLWEDAPVELQQLLKDLTARFGQMPLRQLLRYVYTTHKDYTINSEIKDQLGLA
jgi:hypothetical protein